VCVVLFAHTAYALFESFGALLLLSDPGTERSNAALGSGRRPMLAARNRLGCMPCDTTFDSTFCAHTHTSTLLPVCRPCSRGWNCREGPLG